MPMKKTLREAEGRVARLVARTNRSHGGGAWSYELTSDVDNIEVVSVGGRHMLRIHPCWLRYVVAQGDFKSCIADEIEAWYLLQRVTAEVATVA